MKKLLLPFLLLSACSDREEESKKGSPILTIKIPTAQLDDEDQAGNSKPVQVASGARPRLDANTGVCMGRWRSHYTGPRESIILVMDRDGTYRISGGFEQNGRWKPESPSVRLGVGRLFECGKVISHLAINGREYSLRRIG